MRDVKRIPLSKLFKIEVGILLTEVVEALGKHNLEALRLKDHFDLLQLQLGKAEVLKYTYGPHPLSPQLATLHKKRLKYAALINLQLQSLEKLDCTETLLMVEEAQRLSKMFLTYLGQKRLREVEFQIGVFFIQLELEDNANSKAAFIGLGLQPYLDELQETNNIYKELYYQREREINERPKTSNRLLERETEKIMRQFFEQVNTYQNIFKDIDYSKLISDLNEILTEYSKLIRTRVATNKRRARKKAALEEAVTAKENVAVVVEETITATATETQSSTATETQSSNNITATPTNNKPQTSRVKGKPKRTPTKKGTKGNEIVGKDLRKVLKRGGKGRR